MTKTARATHANRGVEAAYRKALTALIAEMHGSVAYWVIAGYRKTPPVLAHDSTPSQQMRKVLDDLAKRWKRKFEDAAPYIAELYLRKMFNSSDNSLKQALKDAGWSVKFKMTPAVRDAFNASLAENVGLIKSIPEKYLQQVEGIVMRAYSGGRNLKEMTEAIAELYPAAKDRATLIARDQSNKANSVVNRTRQLELGIKRARWMHSHGGKEPRLDHLAADGKEYDIEKGCLISGEYIQPGEMINCRCTSRPILP